MKQLLIINDHDNVATATSDLIQEQEYSIEFLNGDLLTIILKEKVGFGHKVAIKDIRKGSPVYKYGEKIGLATQDIHIGEHVHVHNVNSRRGRGDLVSGEE